MLHHVIPESHILLLQTKTIFVYDTCNVLEWQPAFKLQILASNSICHYLLSFFNSAQRCTAFDLSLKCTRCADFTLLLTIYFADTYGGVCWRKMQLLCFSQAQWKAQAIACLIAFTFTLLQILNNASGPWITLTEVLKPKPRRRLQKLRTLCNSPTQNLKQALGFATALNQMLSEYP